MMDISLNYTPEEFYEELKKRFMALLKEEGLYTDEVKISTKALSPEEAIGITKRKDFPIITGKDIMIQASCHGLFGQAFTDAPATFEGTLGEICEMDLDDPYNRGLFIASLNAVMGYLGKSTRTVHCRNNGPEMCACDVVKFVKELYGNPKIGLIGYQPSMLDNLSKEFEVRVVDLCEDNIGTNKYGVIVEDGSKDEIWKGIMDWADIVLCTGSTVCNGTIVNFLPWVNKILFFGTTLAGAATLMELPRMCFADNYQ